VYVTQLCAFFFAPIGLLIGFFEEAWGPVGLLGMVALAGSITCGIALYMRLREDAEEADLTDQPSVRVGLVVLLSVGAILLMFLGMGLVVIDMRG
jgi:hypothetical protein